MKRLTENYKEYISRFPEEMRGKGKGYSMRSDIIYEKLGAHEDLEERGEILKNPQEIKNKILERMKEFMDEYRSYSQSSIDHFGGKADAMETAMRIVKAIFSEVEDMQKENDK